MTPNLITIHPERPPVLKCLPADLSTSNKIFQLPLGQLLNHLMKFSQSSGHVTYITQQNPRSVEVGVAVFQPENLCCSQYFPTNS